MLETLDLRLKFPKKDYRDAMSRLGLELAALQRAAFENQIPVLIVFEGWDASGKGDAIRMLVEHMDPRGFAVYATRKPTEDEALRPRLWRFWSGLPTKG